MTAIAILGGGIGSKELDLKLSDFRSYSRPEILELLPFRFYSLLNLDFIPPLS